MILYVVIVTYNPREWIKNCFESLQNSTIPLKTIVIDNGSTDGSQEIIKGNFPKVDFVQSERNLGFGKANNIGIKRAYDAGADYVFLLNQDAWVVGNTLEKLIEVAQLNPQYGIISPIHLNGKGDSFDYNFSNFIIPSRCKNLLSDIYLNKTDGKLYETNFINAAAWLLSKKCIERVGGFSPSFFHYGEDDNYCQRALYHNLKIGVYPKVEIFHDREQRVKNNYFRDEKLIYRRKIIIQFSNPLMTKSKYSYYKSEIKNLYFSFLSFNLKAIKKAIVNLIVLNSINFSKLSYNKEQSRIESISFLKNE